MRESPAPPRSDLFEPWVEETDVQRAIEVELLAALMICAQTNDTPTMSSEFPVHPDRERMIDVGPIDGGHRKRRAHKQEKHDWRDQRTFSSLCHFSPTFRLQL